AREERQADQGEVPDEVERLVPSELVGETQGAVHDAVLGEDDGVFEGATADQPHSAQWVDVAFETKGSGAGEQMAESLGADDHFDFLLPYERVEKIDVTPDAELVRGENGDAPVAFDNFQGFTDAKVATLAALATNSGTLEHPHEQFCG